MASVLNQYRERQAAAREQMAADKLSTKHLLAVQELNYRICILETFQSLCMGAPLTLDTREMGCHFQMLDAYMRFVLTERKFGPKTDEEGQKKRQTAHSSLERVVMDGKRRFTSFTAASQEQYRASVSGYVNTVLPVWLQYRDTYIQL